MGHKLIFKLLDDNFLMLFILFATFLARVYYFSGLHVDF
jgi:hypothetical protein